MTPIAQKLAQGEPLRLLFLNDIGFLYGAGIAHHRQIQSFLLAGHQVMALCWQTDETIETRYPIKPLQATGIWHGIKPLQHLHRDYGCSDGQIIRALVQEAKRYQPDAIIVGNIHGSGWPLTLLPALQTVAPVVAYLHDGYYFTGRCAYPMDCPLYKTGCNDTCPTAEEHPPLAPEKIAPAWQLRRAIFSGTPGIALATNSRWTLTMLQQAIPNIPHADVVYLGIDTNLFKPIDRSVARQLLGLPENKFLILAGGINVKEKRKGGHLLKQIIKTLNNEAEFIIFGAEAQDLRNVNPTGLVQYQRKMPLLYSAADLFIGTSLAEAFGQTFCEASACGIPSVAFNVGGISEIARHNVTARLVEGVDVDKLVTEIRFLKQNPEIRQALGINGRQYVTAEFSLAQQANRWLTYLQQLPPQPATLNEPQTLQTVFNTYGLNYHASDMLIPYYHGLIQIASSLDNKVRLAENLQTPPWGIETYSKQDLPQLGYDEHSVGKTSLLWLGAGTVQGLGGVFAVETKDSISISLTFQVRPGPPKCSVQLVVVTANGKKQVAQAQVREPTLLGFEVTLAPGDNQFLFYVTDELTSVTPLTNDNRPLLLLLEYCVIKPVS